MPFDESRLDSAERYRFSCMSPQTVKTTAVHSWKMMRQDYRKLDKKLKVQLALEATSMDSLAEMMLVFHQKQHVLDSMARVSGRDDLPASFYNTQRLVLNDCQASIVAIHELREKTGRDRSKPPEKRAERRAEARRVADINFECQESQRVQGCFYDNRHGVKVMGEELLAADAAVRDIIRMRMLPKSPYEDHMIAQMLGALSDEEKKLDPEKLSKEERENDLHRWNPEVDAEPGMSKTEEYTKLAKEIFLARIQEYNETWRKAEEHVDGLLAAKGLRPGMHFPYIGLPPVVKKAAQGDPEAIAEIKEAIVPRDKGERDFGRACRIIISLLVAFTCAWTCVSLIAGPSALAIVMSVDESGILLVEDEVVQQALSVHDATVRPKVDRLPFDSWHNSSWQRLPAPPNLFFFHIPASSG